MTSTRDTAKLEPAELFGTLADRTRLRILSLLRAGECCVCDLVDTLDAPQPAVSRHLGVLRRAGLVQARRDGAWMHYRLADGSEELLQRLYRCIEESAADCRELERDGKRMQKVLRARGCC